MRYVTAPAAQLVTPRALEFQRRVCLAAAGSEFCPRTDGDQQQKKWYNESQAYQALGDHSLHEFSGVHAAEVA